MIGLLVGIAAGLWAVKWLLLPAVVIGVGVWALRGYLRSLDEVREADAAVEAAAAEIAARADQQHQWVFEGDPRGIYGEPPAPETKKPPSTPAAEGVGNRSDLVVNVEIVVR